MIPVDDHDWADKDKEISMIRGARSIFINAAPHEYPNLNFSQELKLEIGGVFGLGAQSCKTVIHLPKNEFLTGQ